MKKIISYILILPALLMAFGCNKAEQDENAPSTMKGIFFVKASGISEVIEVPDGQGKTLSIQAAAEEGQVSDKVVTISFKGDPDAVAAYNKAHGKNYVACPGTAYEFTSNEVMMPKYGTNSTSAKLKLGNAGLEDGVTYLLPVTIGKVVGTDNWAPAEESHIYILMKRAYVAPDAGKGTREEPYTLYTVDDLKNMKAKLAKGKTTYFRLMADIDMAPLAETWEPLNWESPYDLGVDFDGDGHTLSNFSCNYPSYPSFFGVLYGKCYNVNFINATVARYDGEGNVITNGATGIVGSYCGTTNVPAEAHHIHVQGVVRSVTGNKNGTGGLFGRICEAKLYACSADIDVVSTEDYVGGIFGYDSGVSQVSDCWTKGTVVGAGRVGGIGGGFIKATSSLTNCYSLATVKGSHTIGGIAGGTNLDKKDSFDTNLPDNHIENCLAWNEAVENISTDGQPHWSSGAIIGLTALKNFLVDCYRKPGFNLIECESNVSAFYGLTDQDNASPGTPLVVGGQTYNFAYHGKAASATATVSSLAQSLGWDKKLWDFSGDYPVIKPLEKATDQTSSEGQLPDFPENEFYQ